MTLQPLSFLGYVENVDFEGLVYKEFFFSFLSS